MKNIDIHEHLQGIIKSETKRLISNGDIEYFQRENGKVLFKSLRTIVNSVEKEYGISINTKHVSVVFRSIDGCKQTAQRNGKEVRTGFFIPDTFFNEEK